ncbi:MAG: hypothetical protein ICV63_11730 [Coleofasciculus sp. Co-bin14]|nr:hypothetical protein [Coleofasciculus sp. Co-bin14]
MTRTPLRDSTAGFFLAETLLINNSLTGMRSLSSLVIFPLRCPKFPTPPLLEAIAPCDPTHHLPLVGDDTPVRLVLFGL